MSSQRSKKRKQPASVPKECANPIFEEWITEWRDDAVAKNSKLQYVYSKALASLRRYPLHLSSGKECQILENFGPGICNQIDSRIAKEPHRIPAAAQGASVTAVINLDDVLPGTKKAKLAKANKANQDADGEEASTSKKRTSKRAYIPAFRSGAYALLITLFRKEATPNYRGYMLKSELLQEAQDHCDASMTTNPNGQHTTAWNGMATLVTKNLVMKKGNPVKFLLSVEGRELAAKLINADHQNDNSQSQKGDSDDEGEVEVLNGPIPRVRFEPHEFEVLLCVDTSETTAKSKKEEVLGELRKNGVPLEVVKLNVGDFVWICRKLQNSSSAVNRRLTVSRSSDMVLPYVVERKRTDDLASSIRDGRFHEQKHRLEQTGLEPIYLIESYGSGDFGLADGALLQGVANTQITNRFIIQETDSLKDTCAYLTHMTRHLSRMYQGKAVSSCTKEEWPTFKVLKDTTYLMSFSDFNEFGTKARNWTVSEMFARHLMKVRGLSAERAFAIIQKYPTVADLLRAYRNCSTAAEQQSLLASIRYGTAGKTVGQAISKIIHGLYTSRTLG